MRPVRGCRAADDVERRGPSVVECLTGDATSVSPAPTDHAATALKTLLCSDLARYQTAINDQHSLPAGRRPKQKRTLDQRRKAPKRNDGIINSRPSCAESNGRAAQPHSLSTQMRFSSTAMFTHVEPFQRVNLVSRLPGRFYFATCSHREPLAL